MENTALSETENSADILKFAIENKAYTFEKIQLFPRSHEDRDKLREEFLGIFRPLFFKYLPYADPHSVKRIFNKEEIDSLRKGFPPTGWQLHHQQGLLWGGRNASEKTVDKIMQMPLPEQVVQNEKNFSDLTLLRIKVTNYLRANLNDGNIRAAFIRLFGYHLVLLPQKVHKRVEDAIKLQEQAFYANKENYCEHRHPSFLKEPTLFIIKWNTLIYGGDCYAQGRVKQKEFVKPQKIRKHKRATDKISYIRAKERELDWD